MATIQISDAVFNDYKKTAEKWEKTLLDLPLRAANDVLKYMRGIKGLRGKQRFGSISTSSQFAPFDKTRTSNATVAIDYRTLETFHGNVIETFSPVDYAMLTMGYDEPYLGEKIKGASTTLLVLAQLAKTRGKPLAQAALTGVRNENGTTSADLCDGLLTIAAAEMTAGNISVAKGNLYTATENYTDSNACDIAKDIVFSMNPFLRREDNVMLVPTDFLDKYNESYLATHSAVPYNTSYDQPYVEGSNKKVTLVGLPELDGQHKFIITQRSNMLWGTDNDSDQSFVDIRRDGHYSLSFASDIFFGVNFHSIDARRLMIADFTAVAGA